ncbi:MAG: RtcB family protein [Firmicutes bacterium]|nr:RtcB family protein [Bacillota bacterium]
MLFLHPDLLAGAYRDESLAQLSRAATLPGVVGPVIGLPDLHQGYGLPIGGVLATDAKQGVVSSGAVGMDINCGVRLLQTGLTRSDLGGTVLRDLLDAIRQLVPAGVGRKRGAQDAVPGLNLRQVVVDGAAALVEADLGTKEDLERTEEYGKVPGADLQAVGSKARERGEPQLGTLGGGNHFIEIQEVDKVLDHAVAEHFGIRHGGVTVMIHTGSRAFGHQVCTDYIREFHEAGRRKGPPCPDRGLAFAPIDSPEGRRYLAAMASSVNYAFANRQFITAMVRKAIGKIFGRAVSTGVRQVYDVAHNIGKFEEHAGRRLLVHRKGATRSLPPGHPGNPPAFRSTGHPVIVPGSMGTASYVLVGMDGSRDTFHSACHGAGRVRSRSAAEREIGVEQFLRSMDGVEISYAKVRDLLDEAPAAYKDIELVTDTVVEAGIARKVARLKPLGVIKGSD